MNIIYLSGSEAIKSQAYQYVENNLAVPVFTPCELFVNSNVDALWALGNWELFESAKKEVDFAKRTGVPVLYSYDDLLIFLFERIMEE